MRGEWLLRAERSGGDCSHAPQGLTQSTWGKDKLRPLALPVTVSRMKRLKDRSNWEVSERRQVGDAEAMMYEDDGHAWWRRVGLEESL